MFEEDQNVDVAALPKFDMPLYESEMTAKDVKSLAIRHGIPLDLHPVALTKGWTMDQLPDDMIGLYEQYFEFSGIKRDEIKIDELKGNSNSMSIEINKKERLQQLEQVANLSTYPSKGFNSFCYDDDDEDYTIAVTPSLSTEEPDNSLSMGDEHLDTIPATKSNEFIKYSVENLVPIPSESEGESEFDVL
nr:hypothetical protein [Tanacetum cinerariifolium]